MIPRNIRVPRRHPMHAWLCENPIGVDALVWKELPTPEPQAGEVRVAIKAASLNFPDILIVQNKYQMKPPLPFVPGSEYAGLVEAVGDGVKHLKVGDPVAAFGGTGGFGTHAIVKAALAMPLPSGFAFDDASAFVLTYATTHHALLDRAALSAHSADKTDVVIMGVDLTTQTAATVDAPLLCNGGLLWMVLKQVLGGFEGNKKEVWVTTLGFAGLTYWAMGTDLNRAIYSQETPYGARVATSTKHGWYAVNPKVNECAHQLSR